MSEKRKNLSYCCVPPCKGGRFDLTHKFPRDPQRCKLWLDAIGCSKLKQISFIKLSQVSHVCSRHFRVEDYKHAQSRGLNMTAIPSLNLRDLSELHLCRAYTSREAKVHHFVTVPALIGIDPCDIETEKELRTATDDAEIQTEMYECVEMIPVEDLEETNYSDKTKLHTDLADEESLKPDHFSTFFEVNHPSYENKLSLNTFWLRCHCRCSLCYDPIKRRRKISPMDIPNGIQPKSVEQADGLDVLTLEWDDGHKSMYDVNFLFSSQIIKERPAFLRIPWHRDSDNIQHFAPIEFNALVSFDENIELVFQTLSQNGVAVVENIPTQSKAMAKLVLCRLFPQLQTAHFEKSKEIQSDICTNITYSSVDCGLKCFFIQNKVEIVLVDGLNAVHELKALNASAFKTLSRVKVPLEISDENVKWGITTPIIEVDLETEEILHLRLDVRKMGILNTLPQAQIEGFYDGLKEMIQIINVEKNQWVLAPKPGTMVILDNWRVFHKVLESSSILESYLERKDYVSRMRYLGLT